MYNLFLDDIRDPKTSMFLNNKNIYPALDWVIVRSYDEFVSYINNNGMPKLISFDHDLADEHYGMNDNTIEYQYYTEKTGYECAKWLINYCMDNNLYPPDYYVHSMNTVGALNIRYLIENYKKHLAK